MMYEDEYGCLAIGNLERNPDSKPENSTPDKRAQHLTNTGESPNMPPNTDGYGADESKRLKTEAAQGLAVSAESAPDLRENHGDRVNGPERILDSKGGQATTHPPIESRPAACPSIFSIPPHGAVGGEQRGFNLPEMRDSKHDRAKCPNCGEVHTIRPLIPCVNTGGAS